MAETVHPDQEIVYTVEIRRPFEVEPPHDGTAQDAMTEFERELHDRLPAWRVRVFARGFYKPPIEEVTVQLELLVLELNAGAGQTDKRFRKLMYLVGVLRDRLAAQELDRGERKNAERALREVKKMLGLA